MNAAIDFRTHADDHIQRQVHQHLIRRNEDELVDQNGHNDHRIVMALSLLCSITGGTITGAEAVAKSYPNFFETIASLGIEVKIDDI